jgi:hypothetical protein
MKLYLHPPMRLHGVLLSQLSTETAFPCFSFSCMLFLCRVYWLNKQNLYFIFTLRKSTARRQTFWEEPIAYVRSQDTDRIEDEIIWETHIHIESKVIQKQHKNNVQRHRVWRAHMPPSNNWRREWTDSKAMSYVS